MGIGQFLDHGATNAPGAIYRARQRRHAPQPRRGRCADGTAVYLGGGVVPPNDNPGQPFTGVTNVIASGGDRGSACVLTETGAVFSRTGAGIAPATLGGNPLTAQAAPCPL